MDGADERLCKHGSMDGSDTTQVAASETGEQTFCYVHANTPTGLRCTRCDRPICGRCSIPASVGQHCPDCVAEARRGAPKVRSVLRAAAPAVVAIIVLDVLVYFAQRLIPGLTPRFASYPPEIASGEWWRLASAMFLHSPGFLFHILANMFALYLYGPDVEQAFGTRRFVVLYLVSGLVATASSYAFGPCHAFSVGASGAIFGVIGALLVYIYNRRRSAVAAQALRGILMIVGLNLLIGFAIPHIDKFAHMGGLVGGLLIGAGFDHRSKLVRVLAPIAGLGAALALIAWRTSTFAC